ncbi:hypothetical protein KBC99_02480, partial [Candidatus Saccharibacteria bacterium]|nr:hypothetical protein [Candidatus Saccharibacteria bacterium]
MKRLWSLYVAFFVIAIGLALASPAHAATIAVSASAPDNTTSGNGCSIREAIDNANNDTATHPDCIAGSGTDTISIPAATYNIATALPAVTTPIIVDGAGPDQTIIDGQNTGGFALFQGSSTVIRDMTFLRTDSTGLSITNGDAEIYNFEYDGTGLTTETSPIDYYISDNLDHSIIIDGVYLHDFEITHTIGLYGIGVDTGGSNNSTSTLRNITISNIRNLDLNASVGAILIGNGTSGFENGGIHNSVLENITIQGIYGVTQVVGLVVGTLTNTETASS